MSSFWQCFSFSEIGNIQAGNGPLSGRSFGRSSGRRGRRLKGKLIVSNSVDLNERYSSDWRLLNGGVQIRK